MNTGQVNLEGENMLLRVAIVDDLAMDAQALQADLEAIARDHFQLVCECFPSGEAFLARFSRDVFDLILMDIRMDGISGIDAAQAARRTDPRCLIAFLTTSPDFAWQSFPVHPFDYLLKPVHSPRLQVLISEALRALDMQEPEIEVRGPRQTLRLPLSSIQYAVAQNHVVIIATTEGEYRSISTFSELQGALLQDARFLLCNRGVIINMDAVHQFDDDCIRMTDGTQFSVRQKSKSQLFNAFTQYQFRSMKKGEER